MKIKGTMRHFCWLLPVAFVVWYARRNCQRHRFSVGGSEFDAVIPLPNVIIATGERWNKRKEAGR